MNHKKTTALIPIARPSLGRDEMRAVQGPIRRGWVTQGPEVAAFESEFASVVGASFACAVSSCTTALFLALKAAGVGSGDEVITVSHSFIATANSIRYLGALPVFVDIQPDTFNMDPAKLRAAFTRKTKAILCVHQMGLPCDLPAILRIASRMRVPVIEDAACAVGSRIRIRGQWHKIGRPHGEAACFSFHPRKVITTGDGGMITTSIKSWDAQFRLWRQHGMSVSDLARHGSKSYAAETYDCLGYNFRMTDLQAAIGRVQLGRLEAIVRRRRFLATRYQKAFKNMKFLRTPSDRPWTRSNWQSYCVRFDDARTRTAAMIELKHSGIASKSGIMCAHREKAYGPMDFNVSGDLRESERAQDHCLLLPLFPSMSDGEQGRVIAALKRVCKSVN